MISFLYSVSSISGFMKFKSLFIPVFLISFLSSCSWIYYVPNKQNVTLFKQKNEFEANLALATGEQYAGLEMQAAYSITNHIAIQGNYFSWFAIDNSFGFIAEAAPGYFTSLGDKFVFETYAGIGRGHSFYPLGEIIPSETNVLEVQFDRYFIQPGIGFTTNNFDIAFSTRFCVVDYFGKKPYAWTANDDFTEISAEQLNQFYTLDPALTIRLGFRNVKFQFQTLYVYSIESKFENGIFYDRWNINLGIQLSFGGHFNPNWSASGSEP